MLSRPSTPILSTLASVVLVGGVGLIALMLFTNMCGEERPVADEKVGTYGKSLGEAKEDVKKGEAAPHDARVARKQFEASSQVQLGEMAAEVELRGRVQTTPIERIESLRKDYWVLVELRQHVLDSTDETFDEAFTQYEAQVDTMREQFLRIDRGQLP